MGFVAERWRLKPENTEALGCLFYGIAQILLIGASLSEPHTYEKYNERVYIYYNYMCYNYCMLPWQRRKDERVEL